MWEPRDPNAKTKKPEVNTFGLDDNCYYVTAAKLLDTTVGELFKETEEMQISGGASPEQIDLLLQGTHRAYKIVPCGSIGEAERIAEENCKGLDFKLGIAFTRKNGTGHAVVMKREAAFGEITFKDYQMNKHGSDASDDVRSSQVKLVYWFI